VEKKHLISRAQKEVLLAEIGNRLVPDEHGMSTISNLYIDTPDFRLIRNSIDATAYKEKLRLRSYGTPKPDDKVFLEIKKKFKGVVYKRRISLSLADAYAYLYEEKKPEESQIMNEIQYSMEYYNFPKPKMALFYEREAYFVKDDPTLRLTFDCNIRYREDNLYLERGTAGKEIIDKEKFVLEVKTDGAMPLWLAQALERAGIFPRSFSKYGISYRLSTSHNPLPYNIYLKGEEKNVCIV
jgi:hypothetical protein